MTDHILKKQRAAFADFGLFAFKCKDIDELLTRASELVSEALEVDLVKVLEHRPERNDLLLRAGVNWEPGVVGKVTFADHKHSPAGFALLTDEPVVSRDVSTEDRFEPIRDIQAGTWKVVARECRGRRGPRSRTSRSRSRGCTCR